ncbi:MAG: hypothetical protein H7A25_06555 [Leptospiraceae bacterium]|nr:hypothetical protein [Leptospiraceae bacterium]
MEKQNLFAGLKGSVQIDHMLRSLYQQTSHFSSMADHKANIILGASFLIFTLTLNMLQKGEYSYSLIALTFFSIISSFFAIIATMPSIQYGKDSSFKPNEINPLFFGSFHRINQDEYLKLMSEFLRSEEKMYEAMVKDIYNSGLVLQRKKFFYLGISYRIFMAGLILSFIGSMLEYITLK